MQGENKLENRQIQNVQTATLERIFLNRTTSSLFLVLRMKKYLSQNDLKLFRKGGIHYFNNLMFNSKLSGKLIIK